LTARPASRSQSSGSAKRMPPRHPILKFHVAEQRSRPPVRPAHPASPTTTSTPANLAKAGPFFNSLLSCSQSSPWAAGWGLWHVPEVSGGWRSAWRATGCRDGG
jgi:hypothetical protein